MKSKVSSVLRIGKALWFLIIIVLPAIPYLFPSITLSPLATYLLTPAWISLIVKLLYDNSDQFYFWSTKSVMWLLNIEVDWSLSIVLSANTEEETLEELFSKVLKAYPGAVTLHNSDHKKIFEMPFGCTISITKVDYADGLEDEHGVFHIRVSEIVVPFRSSTDILEKLEALVSNIFLRTVRPEKEKYTFKVKFGDKNPYFGLFVRRFRMPTQSLLTFRVEFDELIGHQKEKVDVSNDRVTLITQSLSSLQTLSRRYITLAAFDLSSG